MAHEIYPYRLLTPGPVPLHPEVLKALSEPVRHHRTPEFTAVFSRVLTGLKWFFATKEPVLVLTSTGSGAMEAALVNTLSPGDEILSLSIGKFGERWADIGERFGARVHRLEADSGVAIDLERLELELKRRPQIKAVLLQAVETSTATANPVREVSQLVHRHTQALVCVDAITGLGAMPLPMDEWQLDVVIGGSQKALMLPTGLSFIALSQKAWQANKVAQMPRYYFDLAAELKSQLKNQTHFSSANSHIVALEVVLKHFQTRGLDQLIARCAILAEATRESARILDFDVFSQQPANSVTALQVPPGVDGVKLRDHLESRYNVTVMGGQDQLQGKILRIGHLGYIRDEDALASIEYLSRSLSDLGWEGLKREAAAHAAAKMKEVLARGPRVD